MSEIMPRQNATAPSGIASFANPESMASTDGAINEKLRASDVEKHFRFSTTSTRTVAQPPTATPRNSRCDRLSHDGISNKAAPKIMTAQAI